MIHRNWDFNFKLTPAEIANEFADLDDEEMVEFFNKLAEHIDTWDRAFCFQLEPVSQSPNLPRDARYIMHQIGEYSSHE